jgi:hypothetical protein
MSRPKGRCRSPPARRPRAPRVHAATEACPRFPLRSALVEPSNSESRTPSVAVWVADAERAPAAIIRSEATRRGWPGFLSLDARARAATCPVVHRDVPDSAAGAPLGRRQPPEPQPDLGARLGQPTKHTLVFVGMILHSCARAASLSESLEARVRVRARSCQSVQSAAAAISFTTHHKQTSFGTSQTASIIYATKTMLAFVNFLYVVSAKFPFSSFP